MADKARMAEVESVTMAVTEAEAEQTEAKTLTMLELANAWNRVCDGTPWRKCFQVHPSAEAWEMLPDDELRLLAEDIAANGLKTKLTFTESGKLLDGRNRLEALAIFRSAKRVNTCLPTVKDIEAEAPFVIVTDADAVATIIALNARRRHTKTKEKIAEAIHDAILAAKDSATKDPTAKPPHVGQVSRGGRGKRDEIKAATVAEAAKVGISETTVERAIAKKRRARTGNAKDVPKAKVKASVKNKQTGAKAEEWPSGPCTVHTVRSLYAKMIAADLKRSEVNEEIGTRLKRELETKLQAELHQVGVSKLAITCAGLT